ncbi:ABC transporter ATP-binding protein [Natronohydrobacter thiooxidans]|uniref:ABC transporter ATP-binding protein n=1 Tax=Natronohydrobacter thiooxidans TaxID=87172 RepID=UPI0008FF0A07|nr:ABC transporter ATP-binding protein [Natronohydrobacter thiooxidans]
MTLSAENVSWTAGGAPIVRDVTLALPEKGVLGLVGPNGSGKSSLLRLLAGLRRGTGGAVYVDGQPITRIRRAEIARRLAVVEQQATTEVALSAREVVALGRAPQRAAWSAWTERDEAAVASALERTGMMHRAAQQWSTLSGGERQRIQIARALAQEPRELLLDEPTNHLDIRHQLDLMRLLPRLGTRVVVALHDLNQAAAFCSEIAVMHEGRLIAQGAPAQVLNASLIGEVFAVDASVTCGPTGTRISFF